MLAIISTMPNTMKISTQFSLIKARKSDIKVDTKATKMFDNTKKNNEKRKKQIYNRSNERGII